MSMLNRGWRTSPPMWPGPVLADPHIGADRYRFETGKRLMRSDAEVLRAAKDGRVLSSHGPCRFIPTPILLRFADTDGPVRTCRPRFREVTSHQARWQDILLPQDTARRHAWHEQSRRRL